MLRIVRRMYQMRTDSIAPTTQAFEAVGFNCREDSVEVFASQPEAWKTRHKARRGSHSYQQAMSH